jgi:uncharacterized protein (DUF697 family)
MDEGEDDFKQQFENAKKDVSSLGGWQAFRSGDWLLALITRSFRSYYDRATKEHFERKYARKDAVFIRRKLVSVASRNAAIVGALTGAAVTTDEVVALVTGAEGGVGLPANIAIAATAVAAESVLLIRIQLQLVAQLARLSGVPLDPDDPEDILTIIAFAIGGSAAEAAGKSGMKIGGRAAGNVVRTYISKETLKSLKVLGKKVGLKILQKQLIKYTIPIVSIGIGGGWNYMTTRAVARVAEKHLAARKRELDGE